jgi:tetratricopeptide (TPR) repeat protein
MSHVLKRLMSVVALAVVAASPLFAQTKPETAAPPADNAPRTAPRPAPKSAEPTDKSESAKRAQPGPADPKARGPAQAKGYSTALPKTPAEREKTLADLYAHLATAEDETTAKATTDAIERLWVHSGSDTASVLMDRAQAALAAKDLELAIKFLDAIVELQPDYAEGWNRRAIVHHMRNNVERALGDLRRTLALEPNHYRALDGLANILKEIGQKKAALKAARTLLNVHPHFPGAKQMVDELAREVDGQGI